MIVQIIYCTQCDNPETLAHIEYLTSTYGKSEWQGKCSCQATKRIVKVGVPESYLNVFNKPQDNDYEPSV